jgi:ketosteroid isomerase-like protein
VSTDVIDRFVAAWLRGDLSAVVDCLTDDIVYTTSGSQGRATTYRGRDEVAAAFADQIGDDPDLTLGPVFFCGDRAFSEWTYKPATTDGALLRGIDVYTLREGRIAAKDVFGKIS